MYCGTFGTLLVTQNLYVVYITWNDTVPVEHSAQLVAVPGGQALPDEAVDTQPVHKDVVLIKCFLKLINCFWKWLGYG